MRQNASGCGSAARTRDLANRGGRKSSDNWERSCPVSPSPRQASRLCHPAGATGHAPCCGGRDLASFPGPVPSKAQRGQRLHPCLDCTAGWRLSGRPGSCRGPGRGCGTAAGPCGAHLVVGILVLSLLNQELIEECISVWHLFEFPRIAATYPA